MNLLSREEDFRRFQGTYLSRRLVICHLEVDFPESELPNESVLPNKPRKPRRRHVKKTKRSAKPSNKTNSHARSTGPSAKDKQQHHNLQLPGFDCADDISVRTAPAPHNSPAVPADSESGAVSGQADPLCHGQDAAPDVSPLHWSAGAVPTLGPPEQISGTPVPDHTDILITTRYERVRARHDVATANPQDSPPNEFNAESLTDRFDDQGHLLSQGRRPSSHSFHMLLPHALKDNAALLLLSPSTMERDTEADRAPAAMYEDSARPHYQGQ